MADTNTDDGALAALLTPLGPMVARPPHINHIDVANPHEILLYRIWLSSPVSQLDPAFTLLLRSISEHHPGFILQWPWTPALITGVASLPDMIVSRFRRQALTDDMHVAFGVFEIYRTGLAEVTEALRAEFVDSLGEADASY